jgi:sulfoxide reductase heme-binding subunit YedZ
MQPATRSSHQPLGGSRGDWRYRILRFHVPLALASGLVLSLFLMLPFFDANRYPHADLLSGTLPQAPQRGEGGTMDHGGSDTGTSDHSGSDSGSDGHSGGNTESEGHSGGDRGPMDHGGDQTGAMDPDERMGNRSFTRQMTVATGYIATGLLALTLVIGPANLLLRRRNPISSYLTRDVGTWATIFGVVHVIYGLQVHVSGQLSGFLSYFVAPDGSPWTNSFGLANWTGLAATVIAVGLLAISSDAALRKLKARRWKNLQRLNYALFTLVIVHAFFYGAIVRTDSPYTLMLLISVLAVLVGQAVGIWLWRRRRSPAIARLP